MKKNKIKTVLCVVLSISTIACTAVFASGCQNGNSAQNASADEPLKEVSAMSTNDEAGAAGYLESIGINTASLGIEPKITHDDNPVGFQLEAPKDGDTVAILQTSQGNITIRFFPVQAPKAVTNFINLAKEGKYDNTLFSKVTDDFMINGGYCGTSSYGTAFEDEFCDKLFNIRGAVAMSNTGCDSNESAFFINQTSAEAFKAQGGWEHLDEQWRAIQIQLENYKDSNLLSAFIEKNGTNCYNTDIVPEEVKELYTKHGGNPYLDGAYNTVDRGYTVFAQVIDGMDVVDKIAKVKVNDDDIPEENIVIEKVEITTYKSSL